MPIDVTYPDMAVPVAILEIHGNVTSEEELQARAREVFERGTRNILLDLTDVPYMASSGLRALHYIYKLLRTDAPNESDEAVKRGIAAGTWTSPHLKLLNPNPNVMQVLHISGYDMFLEIFRDRKRALEAFQAPPSREGAPA